MKEAFEIRGLWYLNADQPQKALGTLSYIPQEGIMLTLGAAIQNGRSDFGAFMTIPDNAEIILGETPNGAQITLCNCFATNQNFNSETGILTSIWRVNAAFLGIQKTDISRLLFTKCVAEVSNLFEWLNQSGLSKKEMRDLRSPLDIHFEKPDAIDFAINDEVKGRIQFTYSYVAATSYSSTIDFKHSAQLVIETNDSKELSYDALLGYNKQFIHWLTINTGKPCRMEKLSFYHPDHHYISQHRGRVDIPIDAYLRTIDSPFTEPYSPDKFNFTYPYLGFHVPALFTKWFGLYPELSIIIQILSENIAKENSFSEFHFKDIVQALESYHRKRKNNHQMAKAAYSAMKNEILEQIQNDEYRAFIEEKLNFGNEPTLAKRLRELIDDPGIEALNALLGDKETFIKVVKNNRNYLTHYDESLKGKALPAKDLYWLSEKALALLFINVLLEVIPDKDFWEKWLPTSQRWSHLLHE
jgi:hypothetical protein